MVIVIPLAFLIGALLGIAGGWSSRAVTNWCPKCGDAIRCERCCPAPPSVPAPEFYCRPTRRPSLFGWVRTPW